MRLTLRNSYLLSFGLALFLLSGAQYFKGNLDEGVGVRNLEAPYHALLTVNALNGSPIVNHYLLPTVTLAQPEDKFIPWGATVPTKTGDYIYTSFNSPGFLLPYLWFEITGLEINIKNLSYLNSALGALVVLILLAFLFEYLTFYFKLTPLRAVVVTIISLIPAIFSHEVLVSHGIVYWIHSFYQLIFVASLYVIFKWYKADSLTNKRNWALLLLALLFLGPFTEWTGFIFNIGLFIALISLSFTRCYLLSNARKLALWVMVITAFAGALMVAHYSFAIGFFPAIEAFQSRFFARSTSRGSIESLFNGYYLSYGYLLFIFVLSALYLIIKYRISNIEYRISNIEYRWF